MTNFNMMIETNNTEHLEILAEYSNALYAFGHTPAGHIVFRIICVLFVGEAIRLMSWQLFGAIDIYFKEKHSKFWLRISNFTGYLFNILGSVGITVALKNGESNLELVAWGVIYGAVAIILHIGWVNGIWPIVKGKIKSKYGIK